MSKTALIINDTSDAYHWGCFGTSSEIKNQLYERGYTVARFSVTQVYALKTAPRSSDHITNDGFRRAFLADNDGLEELIAKADLVVINGEGTLHGPGQGAFNLLYLIYLSKKVFGKPVHALNMSLFPHDSGEPNDKLDQLYQSVLLLVDTIVLREKYSFDIAQRLGLSAFLGFDCLPLYIEKMGIKPSASEPKTIVLGGGLGISPEFISSLVSALTGAFGAYRLRYVTGSSRHPAVDDLPLLEAAIGISPAVEHYVAESFNDWIDVINSTDCLVSGRFHHSIAAAFLGTPFVTFQAGTPKNDALLSMLGLPTPLSVVQDDSIEKAVLRVEGCLTGQSAALTNEIRAQCLDRAGSNFDKL